MQYEEALKRWGAIKLVDWYGFDIDHDTVTVEIVMNEGFACCGGRDPDCYCSLAESPSADVRINARHVNGKHLSQTIGQYEFDFVKVLKEILAVADGTITE